MGHGQGRTHHCVQCERHWKLFTTWGIRIAAKTTGGFSQHQPRTLNAGHKMGHTDRAAHTTGCSVTDTRSCSQHGRYGQGRTHHWGQCQGRPGPGRTIAHRSCWAERGPERSACPLPSHLPTAKIPAHTPQKLRPCSWYAPHLSGIDLAALEPEDMQSCHALLTLKHSALQSARSAPVKSKSVWACACTFVM